MDQCTSNQSCEPVAAGSLAYAPLDRTTDEIRLLTVRPGIWSQTIKCTLSHAPLAQAKDHFNCLSYAWGDALQTSTISVNGTNLAVGQNLYDFLLRARKIKKIYSMPIWIDAICLNQADIPERNHQVRKMGDIYSSAKYVFVWLGKGQRKTHLRAPLWTYFNLYHKGQRTYQCRLAYQVMSMFNALHFQIYALVATLKS